MFPSFHHLVIIELPNPFNAAFEGDTSSNLVSILLFVLRSNLKQEFILFNPLGTNEKPLFFFSLFHVDR